MRDDVTSPIVAAAVSTVGREEKLKSDFDSDPDFEYEYDGNGINGGAT